MLRVMREHSQSLIIYVMFGIIIVVFAVNFGPGSGSCGRAQTGDFAARVNGEIIRRQKFVMLFSRRLEMMQQMGAWGGGQDAAEMAQRLNLRRQVIDGLIENKLLAIEARRRGLTVSDDDLYEHLKTNYGIEDVTYKQYENWIQRSFQTTVTRFEDEVRDEMLSRKMRSVVEGTVSVSDDEVRENFRREHDRAMVTFVKFDPRSEEVETPSDADIDEILEKERERVADRYEEDAILYSTQKEVRARQILKKLPPDASAPEVAKARNLLVDLKSQIDGGADFAALVAEHSDDANTKDKGGDLGFVRRGQMRRRIVDALYGLKSDETTDEPVRSNQGLHLLQVIEIKEPKQQKLEEVERQVAVTVLQENAKEEKSRERAEGLLAELRAGKKLEELSWSREEKAEAENKAREAGGPLAETRPLRSDTPWVLRTQEAIPRIGINEALHAEIFALTKEEPVAKKIHEAQGAYVIVVLKDREIPDLEEFESQKDYLKDVAVGGKQKTVYDAWIKFLRSQATLDYNPELFPPAKGA